MDRETVEAMSRVAGILAKGRPWFVTVEQAKTIRGLLERLG